MTDRWVAVKSVALLDLAAKHELTAAEFRLLTCLLLDADHTSGIWNGTQQGLATLVNLHRNRVKHWLECLEERGLVHAYFPKGHPGWVRIWCYLDLVQVTPAHAAKHDMRGRPISRSVQHMEEPRMRRNAAYEAAKRSIRPRESAGQSVAPGSHVERHALGSPFAGGEKDDEDANRARSLGENVVDFPMRKNIASPPSVGVTPSRAAASSPRAALAGEPHPLGASLPRVSAGGGSEATPVHPRSLNDTRPSISTTARGLRDPRAMPTGTNGAQA